MRCVPTAIAIIEHHKRTRLQRARFASSQLLDTAILVLKQKNISFLHAWHHCLVIPYTWFWATSNQPWVLGGVAVNTFVHTFMYYYYAVRCVVVALPDPSSAR
jgi:hypothetical protein